MFLVFVLYLICASMFTISKWALCFVQPIFFVAVRMTLAGLLLLGYSLFNWRKLEAFFFKRLIFNIKRDWFLFLQLIIFHIYLCYICDLCALKDITSTESAFIYNLSPFIAAFFSYFYFNEKMTKKKYLGLFIGFCSILPLFSSSTNIISAPFCAISDNIIAKILTLLAVISSSYGWILVRQLVKNEDYSPIFVNGFSMFFGGLGAFITSLLTEQYNPYPFTDFIPFFQSLILIIVVANLIFYNLYGYLLKYYTATFLSFAGFTCPLFAAILGKIFLGENFSWQLFISFFFVSIGLYIFHSQELKQGYNKA